MAKHRAPSTLARIRAVLRPSTDGEYVGGRVGIVTLVGIFAALLLLLGVGTTSASGASGASAVPVEGPHRIDLHLPITPDPQRTGAGTSIPTTDELLGATLHP